MSWWLSTHGGYASALRSTSKQNSVSLFCKCIPLSVVPSLILIQLALYQLGLGGALWEVPSPPPWCPTKHLWLSVMLLVMAVFLRLCFHCQCRPFPRTTNVIPPPLSPLKVFLFSLEFLAEEHLDDTVFKALTPQDHSDHLYPQKYVSSK